MSKRNSGSTSRIRDAEREIIAGVDFRESRNTKQPQTGRNLGNLIGAGADSGSLGHGRGREIIRDRWKAFT
jgi:hypothetical protein